MGDKPPSSEEKFVAKLRLHPDEERRFLAALKEGKSSRSALAATPKTPENYQFPFDQEKTHAAWMPEQAVALAGEEAKPGSHPDYERGYYYPLDLSSVWETSPLSLIPQPRRCLDMCAAPGGKTILAQARIKPGLHIANEIHPGRLGILRHNLARCGFSHLYTQRLRPDQWAAAAPGAFDLILVDAPCSGQSLIAKGMANPGCFHGSTINGNAKRQKGILLSAVATLAPGGFLLYSTCTYSPEENEKAIAYILKRNSHLEAVEVPSLSPFLSTLSDFPAYRLHPGAGFGAGGFTCLIRDTRMPGTLPELADELLAWPVFRP